MKFEKLSVSKSAKVSTHPILKRIFSKANNVVSFLPWANQWGDDEACSAAIPKENFSKKEKQTD